MSNDVCSRARIATVMAMTLAAALAIAAPASAQEPVVEPSPAEAEAALEDAEAALEGGATATAAPDASVAMNTLAGSYGQLEGADRRRARTLLARPTDGPNDQFNDGYPVGAPVTNAESAHFCVFWVNDPAYEDAPNLTDTNGNGIPDYVDSVLVIAEFSYGVEVTPGAMGWAPPKPDKTGCGTDPSAHSDLYLKQLGADGLFGYESPDPGQRGRSRYGYMVLDDDYAEVEYGYADPAIPASVTFAHEFNHLLQQNYDSFEDTWMFESTATWSEEQVYPDVNDWVNYVRAFAKSPGSPITEARASKGLKIYASAVWNHWLDRGAGLGSAVIRRAWVVSPSANPPDFAVAAYDKAIDDRGGTGFEREFVRFAATTAEWRTGVGNLPDAAAYPDVKRNGSLSRGGSKSMKLDHTAYRLLDVEPTGGKLKLKVKAEDGLRCGIGLVARDGDPLTGSVVRKTAYLKKGGKRSVTLDDARRYDRITAVVVNADGRVKGYGRNDWIYSEDGAGFDVTLGG